MGFFTDLLGGPGKVREYGGGFDKAIRPYAEEGLESLQTAFKEGPRVFEGERVAGFTDPQIQAQQRQLALSGVQPDYYETALAGLEEARGLQRQAIGPITSEDIARQRELLAGTAEAEKMAAQRALETSLRDIGVSAGGMGVGQLTGARADILRGGAAGTFAQTMAGIEGQLQRQALSQAEAERGRQASGAGVLAGLAESALGVERTGFGEQQERIGLAADVGREQRALEQQQIQAEMAKFAEEDPMAFAQRYLQTVYAAPTQETTRTQDPSTFQEIIGISSMFNQGGTIYKNQGGGFLSKLFSGKEAAAKDSDFVLPDGTRISGETGFERGIEGQNADKPVEVESQKSTGAKERSGGAAGSMGSTTLGKTGTAESAQRQAALAELQRMVGRQNGGGISSLQVGGSPYSPMARPDIEGTMTRKGIREMTDLPRADEDPLLSSPMRRILANVKEGAKGIASGVQKGFGFYKENIDPFRGYTDEERRRIGFAILGTQPTLGESPLTTVFRAAAPAAAMEEERRASARELARKKAADKLEAMEEPFEESPAVYNQVFKHAGAKLGFVFDMDSNEFKQASGEPLTKAQADKLAEAAAGGYGEYAKTGKLLPALDYINENF